MRRATIVVVALVVIALGLFQFRNGLSEILGVSGFGGNADIKSAAQKATTAADAFAGLAKGSATSGTVPRQSDPAASPLLDAVFNVDSLRSAPNLGEADLGSLSDWGAAGNKVGLIYLLAGSGTADPSQASNDPKVGAQTDRNTALYATELGRYIDAELALEGAIAQIVATDTARSGVDQVRSGLASVITGAITTFPVEGIDPTWRQARLASLQATAPMAAKLLSPAQCTSIRNAADAVGQQLDDVRQGLQNFDALFGNAEFAAARSLLLSRPTGGRCNLSGCRVVLT